MLKSSASRCKLYADMASFLEHLGARLAHLHASRVYERFRAATADVARSEHAALARARSVVTGSAFARQYDLHRVRKPDDLRRALPLMTYEDYRPWIDRVAAGETAALFTPRQRPLMFATSSGTTAQPKLVPVTPAFVTDYRRGWNVFGLKMLTDHPQAILRPILQSTGRYDAAHTPAGIPCGAITGLLARTQKRIVRRFYVGRPEVAHLPDPQVRYYTLMRLGIVRDVAFAITANPATLIQLARTANDHAETLIRDVRDGTLNPKMINDPRLHQHLACTLRPDPARAAELAHLRNQHDALRPRDYWNITFLACWTGGSMGHYLDRLADWWGPVPVRDIGLLASEGRVSLPLEDGTPHGVLDVTAGVYEFIPLEEVNSPQPSTVNWRDLELGQDYAVVLSNATGLLRYRLDDIVRVHDRLGQTPIIEFLHRAGRVASVAGEKLTENQVVAAVRRVCRERSLPEFDFVLAPVWSDPPRYRLSSPFTPDDGLARALDHALAAENEEYESRRKSNRLDILQVRTLPADAITTMDRHLLAQRRGSAEQYKRPCLFTNPGDDDEALRLNTPER